jgi:hypothetical protein
MPHGGFVRHPRSSSTSTQHIIDLAFGSGALMLSVGDAQQQAPARRGRPPPDQHRRVRRNVDNRYFPKRISHPSSGTILDVTLFEACAGNVFSKCPPYAIGGRLVGINVARNIMCSPRIGLKRTGKTNNLSKKLKLELELVPAAAKVMKSEFPPGTGIIQQTRK